MTVSTTVVFAAAVLGVTLCTVSCTGVVAITVAVGAIVDASVGVTVGAPGVKVAVGGVGDTGVNVNTAVSVTGVKVGKGVKEATGVSVGVMKIGAPYSRHPRSGAAPTNPVIGKGGIGSLFGIPKTSFIKFFIIFINVYCRSNVFGICNQLISPGEATSFY